jgi:flagellar basal body rod protein FlgC
MSGEFDLLARAAAGMDVARTVLDVEARNVAAAQVRAPGREFRRLVAQIEEGGDEGPRVLGTRSVAASADPLTEMIGVLDAQRAFEMDASVFDIGKRLAERTLDLGRL